MTAIINKIEEIINKIDQNLSKKDLSKDEVQELLVEFDDEIKAIKEDVEGEHKEIVDEKVGELSEKIDKSLTNEDGWGKVKILLKKNIKGGLEGLKNQIVELEIPAIATPVVPEHKPGENVIFRDIGAELRGKEEITKKSQIPIIAVEKTADLEELAKWRSLFAGQSPEEAAATTQLLKQHLEEGGKKMLELMTKKRKEGLDVNKLFDGIHERGERWTTESAEKLVPEWLQQVPVAKAGVGLITGAVSLASGAATIGVHEFDKTTGDIKDLVEKAGEGAMGFLGEGMNKLNEARKDAKDFAEKGIDSAAKVYEDTRKGAQDVTEKIIDNTEKFREGMENVTVKGMENAADVTKNFFDIFKGTGTYEEKLKAAEKLITRFEEEIKKYEKQMKEIKVEHKEELKNERERLAQELKEKSAEVGRLQQQLEKQSEKTQDNFLSVIEMVTKSRPSSPVPSGKQ